jgi:hypothetical protein
MDALMPRPKRTYPKEYGELKKAYQFTITQTASEMLDVAAEKLGLTRSELLERTIRGGGLELAASFVSPLSEPKEGES